MELLIPTFHKPVPMGTRVLVTTPYVNKEDCQEGTVIGVASTHLISMYIVLLDKPIESNCGTLKAIVINGPEIRGVDGMSWKLEL